MSTTTTTELPYHLTAKRLPQNINSPPTSLNNLSQKKYFLHLLATRCTTSLQNLKQVHALILKTHHVQDHFVAGSLITSYAIPHFGTFSTSIEVLEQVPEPNVFVWNAIIKGCLDNNEPELALSFYYEMVVMDSRANKYTYPPLFKACLIAGASKQGAQIHGRVVKNGLMGDGYIKSSGIQMYSSFKCLKEAKNILYTNGDSDVICFNAMIDGYMKFGNVEDAKLLFEGFEDKNVSSWNAMISGFARCGMIEEAREFFDRMPVKDDVSWSAMIDGYNQGGYCKEGIEIFYVMQKAKIRPRKYVLSSVVSACGNVGALDQGRWIHGYVKMNKIPINAVLGTSFVDMYAKCGRLDLAWEVFEKMKVKEVFSWNAMIGGLAIHGRARDAIGLFEKMEKEMLKPDDITFLNILNACAHGGLVDEGMWYLKNMKDVYGVEPKEEHYGCAVDLLGRAGLFFEAEKLIGSMPMEPNAAILGALLGACWKHGNLELGKKVGDILLELEPHNGGRYTLLSNIYAKAGKWEDASRVRKLMKERGVKTSGGSSIIDLEGTCHEFKVGDSTHPQSEEIYSMLEKIIKRLQSEGYLANTSQVLFDIDEADKENAVWHHSERLAIAYGLINATPGAAIRVMKNLRVCEDCHFVTKLISQVYDREIVVRDRSRFHHFKNGKCSCNDFW
ncbi:Pentatricopeptide repeat-containing protein [Heracleum sosnowskyi]|uniref:Pentatricopeptide repeat-containing protein n=1 Tax=Heracleum sosnowskyi TaxID=360622 RepID=A0AAD8HX10_9APIA|nr:Pentatricopeptide repeat-containing protein [Heracleum sosnowskyi]